MEWAIAIHVGAGDPRGWNAEQQQVRRDGLSAALKVGSEMLAAGKPALDAVEAVIRLLEDDPNFNAGRGAVLTADRRAELDASIMDGSSRSCGAVAGVTTVKNPITLARRVMAETKHVLLAGKGAEAFAEAQKLPLVDPSYFLTYQRPLTAQEYMGTVGCVARDSLGNVAAGTSTGGTARKLPGRIGDSPIVGAGTYAANDSCAVSCTGVGEEFIRNSIAFDIASQMRHADRRLDQAVDQAVRVTLKPNTGGLISVSSTGEIALQHNTPGMSCGAADSSGRFEVHLQLSDGKLSTAEVRQEPQALVAEILRKQVEAWNRGDVVGFMDGYWQSDLLTFSSGGAITRGFASTLARYQQRYPDDKTMGQLTFSELEYVPLGDSVMQVLGVWSLEREEQPVSGRFTLVVRLIDHQWKIVHDHTSTATTERGNG